MGHQTVHTRQHKFHSRGSLLPTRDMHTGVGAMCTKSVSSGKLKNKKVDGGSSRVDRVVAYKREVGKSLIVSIMRGTLTYASSSTFKTYSETVFCAAHRNDCLTFSIKSTYVSGTSRATMSPCFCCSACAALSGSVVPVFECPTKNRI